MPKQQDGPKELSAFDRHNFIWKNDTFTWHQKRADQIRKKYGDKIKQLEGNDPSSIFYFILASASHWVIAVILGQYFSDSYCTIALFGWVLGGFWTTSAGLAMHEAAHQLVFKGRWPSLAAAVIAQMPLFLPAFKTFQFYHLPHHSFCTINPDDFNRTSVQKDKDKKPIYDLDLPTEFEAWLFSSNPLTRVCFLFLQVLLYAFRPMLLSPKPLYLEDLIGFITQSLYIGSAMSYGGWGTFVYLIASTFLGSGLHVSAIHFIAEHYLLTEDTAYTSDKSKVQDTFSYYGPINHVLYNGGYHVEHHDFPRVSWKNLPKVTQIAPEFYYNIPHHNSYLEVMFRFIFNHPGLWQRIKRCDREIKEE
ncbi:hypothetical protein FGO68_gene12102 [Halteria grandinella]|uniref:Fatty acid desaturase domain-containing protein n=1 Tax=Halteria grandinella TaxID=5974 RepID=A0A8J8NN72_HALGN|nr:hypothetical protein FGO68_gene12102 [Halteria grandinella]